MLGENQTKVNKSPQDAVQAERIVQLFDTDPRPAINKIEGFASYASRQAITRFLVKYEIFRRVLHVAGSIVECGVLYGDGVLSWAKFSSALEPYNYTRRIIGFDTFCGFPEVSPEDRQTETARKNSELAPGKLTGSRREWIQAAADVFDLNRAVSHIPKVELVEGDVCETAERYVADNPHTVISLLYLDVDLYKPTLAALKAFLPRMPKGAVVAFDEINYPAWPGETIAAMEAVGLSSLRLERLPFFSQVAFAVLDGTERVGKGPYG